MGSHWKKQITQRTTEKGGASPSGGALDEMWKLQRRGQDVRRGGIEIEGGLRGFSDP